MTEKNTNFDFSALLSTYCDKNMRVKFLDTVNGKAVSSLTLNSFSSLKKDILYYCKDLLPSSVDKRILYFDKEENKMGKSLLHFGGAFYIMDASSSIISYYLTPLLGKTPCVLDMCAAPGGKSIALSFRKQDALIVSNDISYTRALEIAKNTDRLGLANILSMSMDPLKINLPPLFDVILLDVPCSGSGMIRKEPKMKEDWSMEKVQHLLPIQENLLDKAYTLLKKDGILAYSTCSLSIEEDEDQIQKFIRKHPDIEEIKVKVSEDIIPGKYGYHLIPGIYKGEGIYYCFLRKKEGQAYTPDEIKYKIASPVSSLKVFPYRKNQFLLPRMYKELSSLPYIVPGIKQLDDSPHPKCPFDHAYSKVCEDIPLLEITKEQAFLYADGQEITLSSSEEDGLKVICYEGLRLGFGKKVRNKLKNYLPKGLKTHLEDIES